MVMYKDGEEFLLGIQEIAAPGHTLTTAHLCSPPQGNVPQAHVVNVGRIILAYYPKERVKTLFAGITLHPSTEKMPLTVPDLPRQIEKDRQMARHGATLSPSLAFLRLRPRYRRCVETASEWESLAQAYVSRAEQADRNTTLDVCYETPLPPNHQSESPSDEC